ncbi:MAG: hypothetical protein M0P71_17350 [Melioribacteraceae bacterium]|nr:hypothetical protein [Melioribacteraceae bacterium]
MTIIGIHILTRIGILLVAGGTFLTLFGQSLNNRNDKADLTLSIEKKNQKIEELIIGKNDLIEGNKELNIKLDDYQKSIIEKDHKINELEEKVKQAKYGVQKRYTYQGYKSPSGAYKDIMIADDGPSIFENLTKLEKINTNESLQEILSICNEQIKVKPDWFTLYLFKGMALEKLGFKEKAILEFEYVINHGPQDEEFQKPAKLYIEKLTKK